MFFIEIYVYFIFNIKYYIFIERNILKMVNAMKTNNVVEVLKENASDNDNDSRQIIKYKNNVDCGNEIGIVLSSIDDSIFEVFIHTKINKEIISQVLYSTFNNINDANNYYNKLEKYIIDFDLEGIVREIKN